MSLITSQPTSSNASTKFDEIFQNNDKETKKIYDNARSIYWGDVKIDENKPRSLFVAKEVLKVIRLNPYNIYQDKFLKDNIIEYLNAQKTDCTHFNVKEIYNIMQACIKLKKYPRYDKLPEKNLKLFEHLETTTKGSPEYKLFKEMTANIKLILKSQKDENCAIYASRFPKEILELIKKQCIDIIADAAQTSIDISLPESHRI